MFDNRAFKVAWREVELDCYEPLARAVFQVFECVLVPRIVGNYEKKTWMRLNHLAKFLDVQEAAMVSEGMDKYCGVFSGFDNLI